MLSQGSVEHITAKTRSVETQTVAIQEAAETQVDTPIIVRVNGAFELSHLHIPY